jgi:hypothetical protein
MEAEDTDCELVAKVTVGEAMQRVLAAHQGREKLTVRPGERIEGLHWSCGEMVVIPPEVRIDSLLIESGDLALSFGGLTLYLPRLPRLATDQTASLLPVKNLDPAPPLLHHLRGLRERAGALPPARGC